MTYNVQGSITNLRIEPTGSNDNTQRKETKSVKDKWNLGTSTKVNYNFSKKIISTGGNGGGNPVPYSSGDALDIK